MDVALSASCCEDCPDGVTISVNGVVTEILQCCDECLASLVKLVKKSQSNGMTTFCAVNNNTSDVLVDGVLVPAGATSNLFTATFIDGEYCPVIECA